MCCLGVLTANWLGGLGLLLERRLIFDGYAQLCFSGLRWTDVIGLKTLFEISELLGCLTGERWNIGLFIPFSNRSQMSLGAFLTNLSDCGFEQWPYMDTYRSYEGWDPWYPLWGIPSEPLLSYITFRDPGASRGNLMVSMEFTPVFGWHSTLTKSLRYQGAINYKLEISSIGLLLNPPREGGKPEGWRVRWCITRLPLRFPKNRFQIPAQAQIWT